MAWLSLAKVSIKLESQDYSYDEIDDVDKESLDIEELCEVEYSMDSVNSQIPNQGFCVEGVTHKLSSQETCEITDGEYTCLMCDYTSTSHYHFQRHVRMHAEIKKYKCPHCIYSTNSRHGLKIHVMIHTGEKPYTCPHCDYATRNSGHLKRHVRIHTKAKP